MDGLRPIKILSAREEVAGELRRAIFSKELKEGEALALDVVADKLGVSITPVREAFMMLSRDGLIKVRQNKGAIVMGVTPTYIKEHYQIRAILESACVGLVTPEFVNDIDKAYLNAKDAVDAGAYNKYARLNFAFHKAIWESTGNEKMTSMLSELWNGLSMGAMMTEEEYATKSSSEHTLIMEALKQEDTNRAKDEMFRHIMRSRSDMLSYYK